MIPLGKLGPTGAPAPAAGFQDVLAADALADGAQHVVQIGFRRVLLCRIGEQIHAVADVCPHALQPMAGGEIADGAIRCAKHGARFDLCSGRSLNGVTKTPLPVYRVRVREGRIEVAVTG